MTNRTGLILSLGLAIALLLPLAALAQETPEFSGFLSGYGALTEDPEEESRLVYRNPDYEMSDFERLYVEEVLFYLYPQEEAEAIDVDKAAKMLRLAARFDDDFHDELEDAGVDLVYEPGPGILNCRWAMTNLGKSRFRFLPVGRLLTDTVLAGGRGGAAMEAECLDGGSGEIVMQVVKVDRGARKSGVTTWKGADSAVRKWARQLAAEMASGQEAAGAE